MEAQLFQRFAALAYQKAGISIKPGKEALVSARVAKRLRALSIPDAESYLRYLEADESGEELVSFLDVISTHFTSSSISSSGSFSLGAAAHHISQSAASQAVRQLEIGLFEADSILNKSRRYP